MQKSLEILNSFNTVPLNQVFSEKWKHFSKNCFVVESTNIENSSLPYKPALLKANVRTNRMGSTKWVCHKDRSFASRCFILFYFIYLFIYFNFVSVWEPLTKSYLMYQLSKSPYSYFIASDRVSLEDAFSLWWSLFSRGLCTKFLFKWFFMNWFWSYF